MADSEHQTNLRGKKGREGKDSKNRPKRGGEKKILQGGGGVKVEGKDPRTVRKRGGGLQN